MTDGGNIKMGWESQAPRLTTNLVVRSVCGMGVRDVCLGKHWFPLFVILTPQTRHSGAAFGEKRRTEGPCMAFGMSQRRPWNNRVASVVLDVVHFPISPFSVVCAVPPSHSFNHPVFSTCL